MQIMHRVTHFTACYLHDAFYTKNPVFAGKKYYLSTSAKKTDF